MSAPVQSDTLLPAEEIIKLLCTADGKGQWAKMAQLSLLFDVIHEAASGMEQLEREKVELTAGRDNWKRIAIEYQGLLDKRGLV